MVDIVDRLDGAVLDLSERIDFDLPDTFDFELPAAPHIDVRDVLDIDLFYMAIGASDALGIGATPAESDDHGRRGARDRAVLRAGRERRDGGLHRDRPLPGRGRR